MSQDHGHDTGNVCLDQEKAHFSLQVEVDGHDDVFPWERMTIEFNFVGKLCWQRRGSLHFGLVGYETCNRVLNLQIYIQSTFLQLSA